MQMHNNQKPISYCYMNYHRFCIWILTVPLHIIRMRTCSCRRLICTCNFTYPRHTGNFLPEYIVFISHFSLERNVDEILFIKSEIFCLKIIYLLHDDERSNDECDGEYKLKHHQSFAKQ